MGTLGLYAERGRVGTLTKNVPGGPCARAQLGSRPPNITGSLQSCADSAEGSVVLSRFSVQARQLRPQVLGKPGANSLLLRLQAPWRTLSLITALIGGGRCSGFQLEHPMSDGAVILNLQGGVRNGSRD